MEHAMDGQMLHRCRREECSLAHALAAAATGREAFPHGGLFLLLCSLLSALCTLQAACCANHLSLAHIQLGHAVNWPRLHVRQDLHTPTHALTLLGPSASPSVVVLLFHKLLFW